MEWNFAFFSIQNGVSEKFYKLYSTLLKGLSFVCMGKNCCCWQFPFLVVLTFAALQLTLARSIGSNAFQLHPTSDPCIWGAIDAPLWLMNTWAIFLRVVTKLSHQRELDSLQYRLFLASASRPTTSTTSGAKVLDKVAHGAPLPSFHRKVFEDSRCLFRKQVSIIVLSFSLSIIMTIKQSSKLHWFFSRSLRGFFRRRT